MLLITGALTIFGLLTMGLGAIMLGNGLREARSHARHTGKAPVVPLAQARRGDVVHVVGTVTSPDAFASPTGGAPAAYLEVELKQVGSFGGTMRSFLSETHGNEVWMDDGTATGLIRMAHVDLRDRKPVKYVWYPRRQAPDDVVRMLAERGQRVPAVSQTAQNVPDLCYIERALRHGDPIRVHAVVLDVEGAEPGGRPRVLLGTDQRTWLRVSNLAEADLAKLKRRAQRMLLGGAGAVAMGLLVVVGSIIAGNLIAH